MPNAVKILLFIIACCVLGFHFSMLLLHNLSASQNKSTWQYRADHYTYPFFQQSWSLFAPAPSVNYKLFADYEREGHKQIELIADCHNKHLDNLLAGREALLLALCNSAHFFEKSTALKNVLNGPVENDMYFNILEQQALRYLNHKKPVKIKSLKLALYVQDFKLNQNYLYYNSTYVDLKK